MRAALPLPAFWLKGIALGSVACLGLQGGTSAAAKPARLPLVVIDAGHGGRDPGARSILGGYEQEVTLRIAIAVRDRLAKSGLVQVALTRTDDRYVGLFERRQFARRRGADLFLSIHADSSANPEARGPTVYTLSEAEAGNVGRRLMSRPDRSDVIGGLDFDAAGDEVGAILFDATQRMTMNVAASFTQRLASAMGAQVEDRPFHRFADFAVLKAPDMPSALIETGYLTNEADAARLFSKAGQDAIARQIVRAISDHFGLAPDDARPPRQARIIAIEGTSHGAL